MIFIVTFVGFPRHPTSVWRALWWTAMLIAVVAALAIATGLFALANHDASRVLHGWLGHAAMILSWLLAIAVIVAGLASIQWRPKSAIGAMLLALALTFSIMVETMTGYLPNSAAFTEPAGDETRNRFYVLHYITFPFAIGLCVSGLALLARSRSKKLNPANDTAGPVELNNSDNPYCSPKEE